MYSKKILDYFENPINMGKIIDADGIGITENEICSDIIKIYIKVNEKDVIENAKFEVKGCPPVIASCCEITEIIKNMKLKNALKINAEIIMQELGGLPKEKEHCAELVIKTLRKAIDNSNSKKEP